jgi:hypothetical protein
MSAFLPQMAIYDFVCLRKKETSMPRACILVHGRVFSFFFIWTSSYFPTKTGVKFVMLYYPQFSNSQSFTSSQNHLTGSPEIMMTDLRKSWIFQRVLLAVNENVIYVKILETDVFSWCFVTWNILVVYFRRLRLSTFCGLMKWKSWIWKNLKGSGRDRIQVIFQNFL